MDQTSKKFAIIGKIKSLVSKTGRSIFWRGKPKDNEISELIAQKIQKNSYDLSRQHRKDAFTPPYQALAEQLQVEDEQIVQAAIYNLAHIAMVRKQYRHEIIKLLKEHVADETKTQSQRDYAAQKIKMIQDRR